MMGSRALALGIGAADMLALPLALEMRWKLAAQPLTDARQHLPIELRSSTLPGISFRSPQEIDSHAGYTF